MTKEFIVDQGFLSYLRQKAKGFADDAGYGGRHDDGGSRELLTAISIYQAGLEGNIPATWVSYYEEYHKVNDPEYAEYQRLQRKFAK